MFFWIKMDLCNLSLETRSNLASKIISSNPCRRPLIFIQSDKKVTLKKQKYLVPYDISFAKFMMEIRAQLPGVSEEVYFFMIRNSKGKFVTVCSHSPVIEIYNKHKSEDGFLYFTVTKENCFG